MRWNTWFPWFSLIAGAASLAAFLQMEEQRQQEEAKTSLVVTPQQAARDARRK